MPRCADLHRSGRGHPLGADGGLRRPAGARAHDLVSHPAHRCHHGPCPYVMRVGATLVVYADAPVYVWHDVPTSSNPKVVALQSYTTTTATFVAVHKGTSTISIGVEDPACWPNNCGPGPPPPSPPTYSFTVIVKG